MRLSPCGAFHRHKTARPARQAYFIHGRDSCIVLFWDMRETGTFLEKKYDQPLKFSEKLHSWRGILARPRISTCRYHHTVKKASNPETWAAYSLDNFAHRKLEAIHKMVDMNPRDYSPTVDDCIELCLDLSEDDKENVPTFAEEEMSRRGETSAKSEDMEHTTSGRYTHRERPDSWWCQPTHVYVLRPCMF